MKKPAQKKENKKNKPAVKKRATKKSPAKKAPPRKKTPPAGGHRPTGISAVIDIGFGNELYIRGASKGLSWKRGALMENLAPNQWEWAHDDASKDIPCKFLINDVIWSQGENFIAKAGRSSVFAPTF